MLKSPNNSSLEKQFVEPNVVDEKDVQSNQATDQHKAFYEYLLAHSHLKTQLKDLKNIH
jgi:hypothetical protein